MSPRSPFARSLLLLFAFVSVLSCQPSASPTIASGQGVPPVPRGTQAPSLAAPAAASASLTATSIAVPQDGAFAYDANVLLPKVAPYLQVRLRIRRPSGRLIFQKTFIRSDVPAGRQTFTFERSIADLDLAPGTYDVALTVASEGNPPNSWSVPGSLRVYDPTARPMRLAPVIRISSAPARDPEGNFVVDPSVETDARDEAIALANAILADGRLRASLAIAPELLEEWKKVSTGYTYASPAGLESVAANTPVAREYAEALARLGQAVATRRLELLDVPYADPDVAGLASIGRERDVGEHLTLGRQHYATSLDESASVGTLTAHGCLTTAAAEEARAHGIRYAFVSPRYIRGAETSVPVGVFSSPKLPLTMLSVDASLSRVFGSAGATGTVDTLFVRAIEGAEDTTTAIPLIVDVGPGRSGSVSTFVRRAQLVETQPWITFVTAKEAAAQPELQNRFSLARRASIMRTTPAGWWSSIAASRRYAEALASVLGDADPEAEAAVTDSLVAESASWAGPDGRWALAERGRSYAASAVRSAQKVLGAVSITASDLTLSSARGSVPFSINNSSDRALKVVLRLTAENVSLRSPRLRTMTLLPAENYVTVPIDLRASTGGRLRLQVVAGTLVIASQTVDVHASYLDRLAIVGGVVMVLGAMLFYIRRRVKRAEHAADPE